MRSTMKRKSPSKAASAAPVMTAAEAVVATLLTHGIEAIYALPGLQNDPLFEALYRFSGRLSTIHTRHEQGAAYMALGAALATGKPAAYAVVPGPGFLNSAAALLTAYSMNAPVLALIGQIPQADIVKRLVDYAGLISKPQDASKVTAAALRTMQTGRLGPAAIECAMDVWSRSAPVAVHEPLPIPAPKIDMAAIQRAAKRLGASERVLIVCGGGAQDAAAEVTTLSKLLQAPVLGFRRGRGVLDSRDPLSVTLPLGRDLWGEADAVLAVGTRLLWPITHWGIDRKLAIIRVDADRREHARLHKPAVALTGDAKPILNALIAELPAHNRKRASRQVELTGRQASWRKRMAKLTPQIEFLEAIRAELPEDGMFVDEVTQIGFAARLLFPVYKPRTFLSPGYQDPLGWGFATALGAAHARPNVPVVAIAGDGGFLFTATELATAMHHNIPLVTIVFNDNAFGNVRRIQRERYGNRLIGSNLTNPDFVAFAKSFGAEAVRTHTPAELCIALRRAIGRRDGPSVIEVPVGAMPSPWEFIFMDRIRGG